MTWVKEEFRFQGGDDFVRLDQLCADFLRGFYGWLEEPKGEGLSPDEARPLTHAADRYLRDFLVDVLETGPADADGSTARQYLGNWYVVNTLSPSHAEVELILRALRLLYRYLAEEGLIGEEACLSAHAALSDEGFFHERLEGFWDLAPESISAWRAVDDYRRKRPAEAPGDSPRR